jgi:hypothetical protein
VAGSYKDQEGITLLGIEDPWILTVHLLCILSTLLCVAYGAMNWNKGQEREPTEISEQVAWEAREEIQEKEIGL